jgi:multidrug efflux pump subunit AcrA (membrane-fusion protein)
MKNKKIWIIAGSVVALLIVIGFVSAGSGNGAETVAVIKGDLVRTVKVSGKIVAQDSADLGFPSGGIIAHIYKKVGDSVYAGEVIVDLDKASLAANLAKAEADLVAAQAEYAQAGGNPESITKVSNATTDTIQAIRDAYTDADDAIHNKVDQLFIDARSANPRVRYSFDGYDSQKALNDQRVVVENTLTLWRGMVLGLDASTYTTDSLARSMRYLESISLFLDAVAKTVSTYSDKGGDIISQTNIDKYKSDILAARNNVNGALSNLITKSGTLSNTTSDVSVQGAKVAAAEANVASYRAALADASIRAPFSGIISKQDAKIGQAVSANASLVSVISKDYKVEAYVPEVSLAGLAVGNKASVTLDAYGTSVVFPMTVSHIDPAETMRDGVSNYKIELVFASADERVRSGMTSNVSIETLRKEGVLLIPSRSIKGKGADQTVSVVTAGDDATSRPITTGQSDSSGSVEVISGLTEGETILLNP